MIKIFIKSTLLILSLLSELYSAAQLIDNTSTFKTVHRKSYFRLYYDNDFFVKTDYYYTQGVTVEYVHPGLNKFPVAKLLLKLPGADVQTGISFNFWGYTPTSISSDSILYGDRPFASMITFKTFKVSSDNIKKRRLSTSLSIGVIGPAALGKEIQTNVHRWLNNILPLGWQYQIQNDIILNYQLNYEKKLLAAGDNFLLNAAAEARLGTLNDKLSGGFNFMAGNFNNPYQPLLPGKRIQLYIYGQARVNLIGYDATMQGGLFNRNNPYIISTGDISRATFQADGGAMLLFKNLFLSYSQSYLTKEFRTGLYHRWGGLSLGLSF